MKITEIYPTQSDSRLLQPVYTYDDIIDKNSIDLELGYLVNTAYNLKIDIGHSNCQTRKQIHQNLTHFFQNKLNQIIHWFRTNSPQQIINQQQNGFYKKIPKECKNDTDFFTLTPIYTIPFMYRIFSNDNDLLFGFDIRSLNQMMEANGVLKNPFNHQEFSDKFMGIYASRNILLEKNNLPQFYNEVEIDPNIKIRLESMEIFHSFQQYGFKMDHKWFFELAFPEIKKLYYELSDLWSYRLPDLVKEERIKITGQEKIFTNWVTIQLMNESPENRRIIEKEILNETRKLVMNGVTKEHRTQGCMYFLIAFVQVSMSAANCHPDMVYANVTSEDNDALNQSYNTSSTLSVEESTPIQLTAPPVVINWTDMESSSSESDENDL